MGMIIAIDAGHYNDTPGKRCLKSIDPNETRERFLNARMAEHVEELLKAYDCEVLRCDDRTGKTDPSLSERAVRANRAGAGAFISIHHNAGINGGKGGGICVYAAENASKTSLTLQRAVYDETVKRTGLKGNRATPLPVANFTVIYKANMPAVLGEFGFMDSTTDVPIILTDDFSVKCAQGIVAALVKTFGIKKKSEQEDEIDMTKDEVIKLIDERIEQKIKTIKDIAAVPDSLKAEVRELLDLEAINGGTEYANNPDDINMPYDALKGVVIGKRYTDKQIDGLTEKVAAAVNQSLVERIKLAFKEDA